jgi:prefoldin subunit 5
MSDTSTERALGRLEGKMEAILSAQEKTNEQLAALSRTPSDIEAVRERIEKIEPMAEEFNRWKERGVGAVMLISLLAAMIGAAVTALWQTILKNLGWGS